MKKKIGIIIILLFLVMGYLYESSSNDSENKSLYTKEVSSNVPSENETVVSSDTFVEKKGTFKYNGQTLKYLLIFPAQYTQMTDRWPLILFLHGKSLRGENLDLVKEYGPTWVAEQRNDFPFVVLAPQCPDNEDWTDKAELLVALLDEILGKYRIDQDKIYLTGTSLGGRGTWYLASQHSEYFAAIAPLAAATPIIPDTWNTRFISLPIWAFHGQQDNTSPLKKDQAMIDAIREQGGKPRFTILANQGHMIAGVYKNQDLYDWFLSHTRHK